MTYAIESNDSASIDLDRSMRKEERELSTELIGRGEVFDQACGELC